MLVVLLTGTSLPPAMPPLTQSEEACAQAARWAELGLAIDVAVNVSGRQVQQSGLVDTVRQTLASTGADPARLILEITETMIMKDAAVAIAALGAIRDLGVRVAIDDFGTGYSSMAYLRQFPVDILKIDRSFISAIGDSAEAVALVHTLIQLGKTLGLETLAEGIEEMSQYEFLQAEACESGQGYLISRPVDAAAIENLLEARVDSLGFARTAS
jgi:EAL domain-containing protein (putative c-di-GMP-specific phosphodiesterase class I)